MWLLGKDALKNAIYFQALYCNNATRKVNTVKLGFKERLNKEQIGNSEPFPVTNLSVYLINSEEIGISEQFCDDQKVPYYQV